MTGGVLTLTQLCSPSGDWSSNALTGRQLPRSALEPVAGDREVASKLGRETVPGEGDREALVKPAVSTEVSQVTSDYQQAEGGGQA